MVHSLLEISYRAFLHPWTYFFSNALLRYIVNFSLIKNAFRPILYFKKSTLKVCLPVYQKLPYTIFMVYLQVVRDRYAAILKEQEQEKDRQLAQSEKPSQSSNSNLSMLDSFINERLVDSKLTRLNEIDRQISTFVIAGK